MTEMPQRFLKPGLTTSKRWNRCSLLAQSFYVRLITLVDDYGRYEGDPELLRSMAFPYGKPDGSMLTVEEAESLLAELVSRELLVRYEVQGKRCLALTRWRERPRVASRYPDPPHPMQTFANICEQMLPPSPSPSPVPSPTPAPEPGVEIATDIELPKGFPRTLEEACVHCDFIGVTREFCAKVWNKAMSRSGYDSKNQPIRSFRHYLATEWAYEQERAVRNGGNGTTPPPPNESKDDRNKRLLKEAL